jgi:hypothetical protein
MVICVIGIVFRKRATTGVYPRLWKYQRIADRARSAAAQEAAGCVVGRIAGRSWEEEQKAYDLRSRLTIAER